MTHSPLYRSDAGERQMREWYTRFRARLPFVCESQTLTTSFGKTHLLITGPPEAPPLLLLHGALAGAPQVLGEISSLPSRYRVYAVDIPGQSVASEHRHLDVKTDQYAQWLNEVLQALALPPLPVLAVSWGGFVALNLAQHFPERILALLLITPAGIVQGSAWQGLTKMYLPLWAHRLLPGLVSPNQALSGLFSEQDPIWSPFVLDAMKNMRMNFAIPPLVQPQDFENFLAPVYLFAADLDYSFPGHALLARAKEIFPNLRGSELWQNCKHCPPFDALFAKRWTTQADAFFQSALQARTQPLLDLS